MQRVIYHRILTHHPYAHTQKKKQCRIDTAEEKEPCKQGKTARLWGKGKLFHSDSNGD